MMISLATGWIHGASSAATARTLQEVMPSWCTECGAQQCVNISKWTVKPHPAQAGTAGLGIKRCEINLKDLAGGDAQLNASMLEVFGGTLNLNAGVALAAC